MCWRHVNIERNGLHIARGSCSLQGEVPHTAHLMFSELHSCLLDVTAENDLTDTQGR